MARFRATLNELPISTDRLVLAGPRLHAMSLAGRESAISGLQDSLLTSRHRASISGARSCHQAPTLQGDVDPTRRHGRTCGVPGQATVAHLGEARQRFDRGDDALRAGTHLGFLLTLCTLDFVDFTAPPAQGWCAARRREADRAASACPKAPTWRCTRRASSARATRSWPTLPQLSSLTLVASFNPRPRFIESSAAAPPAILKSFPDHLAGPG